MRSSQSGRPRLRKREIAFALAAGAMAAGSAALILDQDEGYVAPVVAVAGPDNQTYEVAPFEELSTVGPQDVVITTGETFSVRSEGSPGALAALEAVVEDDKLVIRPKGNFAAGFDWSSVAGATFYVTTPRLDAVCSGPRRSA